MEDAQNMDLVLLYFMTVKLSYITGCTNCHILNIFDVKVND